VRLDHLLSKEHLARGRTSVPVRVHCFLVEHWLFTQLARDGAASTLPVRGAAERALGSPGWVSTLLGPEETGFVSGSSVAGRGRRLVDTGWRLWCCPYLENCTVDASI
jgi:hypothetical protein